VYSGGLALEEALNAKTADGARVGDDFKRIGYAEQNDAANRFRTPFIELHIEQGPILDMENGLLGAVENLQGISWQEVTIRGVSKPCRDHPDAAAARRGLLRR